MEIESEGGERILQYDPEWLAILKSTQQFDSHSRLKMDFPTAESSERCLAYFLLTFQRTILFEV